MFTNSGRRVPAVLKAASKRRKALITVDFPALFGPTNILQESSLTEKE